MGAEERTLPSTETKRLEDTVDRFCEFIEALPSSALAESSWGPRQVLAHLVYHHNHYINLIESELSGRPVQQFQGCFREMNAQAVASYRNKTPQELTNRLRKANQRLVELYLTSDPNLVGVQIKVGEKVWTLAELVPMVEAHIRNHLAKLCKERKSRRI